MIDLTLRAPGRPFRHIVPVLLLLVSFGCGDSPAPAPTPALTLICPGRLDVSSADGRPVTVTLTPPQSAGGTKPVNVTCNQPAGNQYPVGSTTVGCTAVDAKAVTATCSFVVSVTGPPRLRFTSFLAFGDSITAGTKSDPVTLRLIPADYAYTVLLQKRLAARYTAQTPVILNEGFGGESTSGGLARLRPLLLQFRPEVLLLMEGTNDFFNPDDYNVASTTAIANLRQMIAIAKSLNIQVALATITPQRPNGPRNRTAAAAIIPSFNDRVRALAASEGAVLVDVYAGFNLSLIGVDDLHPTELGYSVMADIFYNALTRAYEQPALTANLH